MIRHIVMWNYKDGLTEAEKNESARKIKHKLESLIDVIDGIVEIKVHINELTSSNRDIVLDSLFESLDALEAYQAHPAHKEAGAYVGTVTQDRACIDFYC